MTPTPDELTGLLAGIDPRWRVRAVEPLAEGMLNTVVRVRLGDAPPSSVVVRIRRFEDPLYGQEFAAERFAYPLLPKERPARPHLFGVGRIGAHRAAVFEEVAGPLLDTVLRDPSVSPTPRRALLTRVAEDLAVIHARPAHGFGTLRRVDHASDEVLGFWGGLFAAEADALGRVAPASVASLEAATRGWLAAIAEAPVDLVRPSLVHGDVHARNIIVAADGRCVLIDWEAARLRSPAYDLVQLHALDLAGAPEEAAHLRETYLRRRGLVGAEPALLRLVHVFTQFWKVRMAVFMVLHERPGCAYFGRLADWRAYLERAEFA
ncbi:aminoglycoside phosphotransferase family protein [Salinarimonas sp.]|uniref:phosphotransferase family protein n=1 Tax=Salinarimonas sp. TaxID=2766526 RepID=UPI0032D921BF